MTNVLVIILSYLTLNLQPGLSGNPFFALGKALAKKDWERKTDKAAIIILVDGFWLMVVDFSLNVNI